MSQFDREGLISQSNFLFPTNETGDITAADVRQFNNDLADSLALTGSNVISASYADNALSASHALVADNAIEIFVSAKNTSGFDIPKGTAVHSSGVTGDKININTASYEDPNLMPAIGITQTAINNNAVGEVILTGRIQGLNTSNLIAGGTVYVNGDGSLTSTKPTGSALIQNIGTCVKSNATEGEVLVLGSGRTNDLPNITNGYFWVGDSNGVAEAVPTSSISVDTSNLATTGSNTFNGNQTISGSVTVSDTSATALTITSGPGDTSPITIEGGSNPGQGKFTDSSIKGADTIEAINLVSTALTTSSLHIGEDASIGNTVSIINKEEGAIGIGFSTSNTLNAYNVFDASTGGITNIKGTIINLAGSGSTTTVDVDGVVSASAFSGDGSGLTYSSGISASSIHSLGDITANGNIEATNITGSGGLLVDNGFVNTTTNGQFPFIIQNPNGELAKFFSKDFQDGSGLAGEFYGQYFFNALSVEPSTSTQMPVYITDAAQPRILVYSQQDAANSGTNIEINGSTALGGINNNITIEATDPSGNDSGSITLSGKTLNLTGTNGLSINSSTTVNFNPAVNFNGAMNINTAIYQGGGSLNYSSASLNNEADYWDCVTAGSGSTAGKVNMDSMLAGGRTARIIIAQGVTSGSIELQTSTGTPTPLYGPQGSIDGPYLTPNPRSGSYSAYQIIGTNAFGSNIFYVLSYEDDLAIGATGEWV